jgi:hypothetical protein
MSENIYNFNSNELVTEINSVIKKGISKILNEFIYRYDLLEKTHNQIMNLPSVLYALKLNGVEKNEDTKNNYDKSSLKEVVQLNDKIDLLEKKMDKFGSFLDIIMKKNQLEISESPQLKSSIIVTCENENIKMEINEEYIVDNNLFSKQEKSEEEESEEEESEEEESDEEGETDEEESDEEGETDEEKQESDKEEEIEEMEEKQESDKEEEIEEKQESDKEEEIEEKQESDNEEEIEEKQESDKEEEIEEKQESDNEEEIEEKQESDKEEEMEEEKIEEEIETEASSDEEEVSEIDIDDVTYYTNDEENGIIYAVLVDGDVGDKVGYIKDGEPFFYADEKK